MLKSLYKYLKETIKQWWVLAIGVFFASFQLIPLYVKGETIIPNYVAIGLFIFALFVAQYRVYRKIEKILTPAGQVEKILIKLTNLRSGGVSLRNEGMRLQDVAKIDKWIRDTERWNERVMAKINEFSPPEAGLYKTLDWIDFPPEPFSHLELTSKQLQTLRIHSQRLRSLREIVMRYTQLIVDRKSLF